MPIAGRRPLGNDDFIESITERTQPTVPSPPQATQMDKICIIESYFINHSLFNINNSCVEFMALMPPNAMNVQKWNQASHCY